MTKVTLGVKVFKRTDKLSKLLSSSQLRQISKAIVADDGEITDKKQKLYSRDFGFDIEVLDLDYDAGVGFGRHKIVQALDNPYLVMVDPDHRIPHNIDILVDQLESDHSLGATAGTIIEPDHGRIWQSAKDFFEVDDTLVRTADTSVDMRFVSNSPFIKADFIPQAGVFRKECLEDYSWDPKYINSSEHLDFFVGHWKETDWEFGICPDVNFKHYPGGDDEYMSNRKDNIKWQKSRDYFLNKWGYEEVEMGEQYLFDSAQTTSSVSDRVIEVIDNNGIIGLINGAYVVGKNLLRGR